MNKTIISLAAAGGIFYLSPQTPAAFFGVALGALGAIVLGSIVQR